MTDSIKVEYRVKPVTRYLVTRYSETSLSGSSEERGEFSNKNLANHVASSLAAFEPQEHLGTPVKSSVHILDD